MGHELNYFDFHPALIWFITPVSVLSIRLCFHGKKQILLSQHILHLLVTSYNR